MLFLLLGYHLWEEILLGAGQLPRNFFTTVNITVCITICYNSMGGSRGGGGGGGMVDLLICGAGHIVIAKAVHLGSPGK